MHEGIAKEWDPIFHVQWTSYLPTIFLRILRPLNIKIEPLCADRTERVMESIQTRIPAFLWDSLQNVFYEHDYEFLRQVSYLIKVPVAELKRNLLGSRGTPTTISVSKDNAWWEGQKCPLRVRSPHGLWKQCPHLREAHGYCGEHKGWTKRKATPTLKHKDDAYFQKLKRRKPFDLDGEIVWVSEDGEAVDGEGCPVQGVKILLDVGMVILKDDYDRLSVSQKSDL
jgi:hypothetical protein